MKLFILLSAFIVCNSVVRAAEKEDGDATEQTTEAPAMAEMVLQEPKNHTTSNETIKQQPVNSPSHTIADFIIHPLIALKPRVQEADSVKQADGSSSTPSPWQLFGFNAGQGLGSSVSSLAGTVTGWLGNRIQLPHFIESPIHESLTTAPITRTTTTARPEIVVRIQQRPAAVKPFNSINNNKQRPFRRFNTPNRLNVVSYVVDDWAENDDESEYNDDADFAYRKPSRKRYQNNYEEYDDFAQNGSLEVIENYENNSPETEEVEGEEYETVVADGKPAKAQTNQNAQPIVITFDKRTNSYKLNRLFSQNQRRKQFLPEDVLDEIDEYQIKDQDYIAGPESKRSQTELNFLQQQRKNLLKQIRQFTEAQTAQKPSKPTQQDNLVIKRNGQIVYVAPQHLQIPQNIGSTKRPHSGHYTQPTLTKPLKRPTQYITIPWSQLSSLTNGAQAKPLILTIPQSAFEKRMHKSNQAKQNSNLPLLAPASLIDDINKPARLTPMPTPIKSLNKAVPTKSTRPIQPADVTERVPLDHDKEKADSLESLKDDGRATPLLFIADNAGSTKKSDNKYRQLLKHFNRNRSGRQLNDEQPQIAPIVAESIEAFDKANSIELKVTTENPAAIESPVTPESEFVAASDNKAVESEI